MQSIEHRNLVITLWIYASWIVQLTDFPPPRYKFATQSSTPKIRRATNDNATKAPQIHVPHAYKTLICAVSDLTSCWMKSFNTILIKWLGFEWFWCEKRWTFKIFASEIHDTRQISEGLSKGSDNCSRILISSINNYRRKGTKIIQLT